MYAPLITGGVPVSRYFIPQFSINFTAALASPFNLSFASAIPPPADLFERSVRHTSLAHRFNIFLYILYSDFAFVNTILKFITPNPQRQLFYAAMLMNFNINYIAIIRVSF
jgi:hypothetical protein